MEPSSAPLASTALRPAYEKQEFAGAVTLLHFSRDGSLLFVGVGQSLYAYETSSGRLVASHAVFPRGILHGLDYVSLGDSQNLTVFFGQKRLQCVRDLPETTAGALVHQGDLLRVGKPKVCSDWIFDVQILSEQAMEEGEFPTIVVGLAHNLIQFWNPNTDQLLRSVVCSERCILYSLAFYGRREEHLLVASGTVFQQVLLWTVDGDKDRTDPQQRLHGHDGVIFKLEWSSDARMLASVSDDRTVQLWTSSDESTDPMDVAFKAHELLGRPWTSRFRAWGHTARLWDVRFCSVGIVTTSEDGMCKVWGLDGACLASMQGHVGKHVWRVAIHPSDRLLATGGGDGATKLWDLPQQLASTVDSAGADCAVIRLTTNAADGAMSTSGKNKKKKANSLSIRDIVVKRGSAASNARGFVAVEDGRIYTLDLNAFTTSRLVLSVADTLAVSSTPSVSSFALDDNEQVLLVGDASGFVTVVDIDSLALRWSWQAHASRVMKIWWNQRAHGTLITCGADGGVREWRMRDGSQPQLVGNYVGPAKCATSALTVVDIGNTRNVLCGDARANLFGFARSLGSETVLDVAAEELVPASASFVLRGVHGRDMVATLLHHDKFVYSGGHDGYICSFLIDATSGDGDGHGQVTLCYIGRESIKGITTIKQVWRNTEGELVVFGFHATHAVLYNLSAQYRLFNVECGGWRRPHALLIHSVNSSSIPQHTLVFTPVTKSCELVVQVHSTARCEQAPLVARASLHHQYHGRTTTCVRAIGTDRLVTAGEDNALKLHKRMPVATVAGALSARRWTCLSTGVAHTTTIRALDAFYVASQRAHIVVSGGGKQRLNVWRVRDELDVIEFVCGQEMSEADQDHRILGLSSFAVGPSRSHDRLRLLTACNSEGAIQVLLLDLGDATSPPQLRELGQLSSSKKPILSCDALQTVDRALLVVGSTDGMVNVWDLSTMVASVDNSPTLASEAWQLQPAIKYLAHDMGANCLCVSQSADSPSTFRIVSGGDDQNLRTRELSVDTLELIREARARNASGSALKAVSASRDGRFVYCAGYDQRVGQWRCRDHDGTLQWQSSAFTECADIADLAVTSSDSKSEDTVVVVGQGLQTVLFNTNVP